MEKHFMLDIESTGIEPKEEDLLQVGILELDYANGFWQPGRSFEETQFTERKPTSSFAKEHMTALYEKCNNTQPMLVETFRAKILAFFEECGAKTPDVYLMGWNASNFDVPFLIEKGYLRPSKYEPGPDGKDVRVGDFHYRIYEIGGAVSLVQNALNYADRGTLLKDAEELGQKFGPTFILPAGKEHDALYDCWKQTRLLNGLIYLARH